MIRGGLSSVFILTAAMAALPAPLAAQGQVNRCTTPDGGTIYTDRKCSDLGAMERLPRDAGAKQGTAYRGGCARNLRDLIYEMTAAIDNRDVNRLAGIYHWPGISNRAGYSLMDRLDRIAQQPLVDIVALRPATPVVVAERRGISASMSMETDEPRQAESRRPVALRVQQVTGSHNAPTRTVFGLRRHLGCWWVSL